MYIRLFEILYIINHTTMQLCSSDITVVHKIIRPAVSYAHVSVFM